MNALAVRDNDEMAPQGRQIDALRQIAEQATPKAEIRWRPGRGGKQLPYTDTAYVIRTLNNAFGFNWDFETDQGELLYKGETPFEVKVRGKLTVRLAGESVTKMQYGCQPVELLKDGSAPVSLGDCYKGAASDALKKCASLLGVALDLYDSDSEIHGNGGNRGQAVQKPKTVEAPKPTHAPAMALADEEPEMPQAKLRWLAWMSDYSDRALLKWLRNRYSVDEKLNVAQAVESLGEGELEQAITLFRNHLEAKEAA